MGAMPVIEIKQSKTLNKLVQKEQSLTKINFFLDKRKRFRDLIRAHINKQINPFNEINKHFITSKRRFNKNNSVENKIEHIREDEEVETSNTSIHLENVYTDCCKDELIRNKYYERLCIDNYLVKTDQSFCQNIIIFDWDDTIMCTSYISPSGEIDEQLLKDFQEKSKEPIFEVMQDLIIDILNMSIQRGHTYIVTNAASGWVEFSASIFFPKINDILDKVIIISARSWFDKEFPSNSKMWKKSCFEEISKIYDPYKLTNLITIGDSLIEMEASYTFAKRFVKCYKKTIKLKNSPTPKLIVKQLNLIMNDFPSIFQKNSNIIISIKKEEKVIDQSVNFKSIIDKNNTSSFINNTMVEKEGAFRDKCKFKAYKNSIKIKKFM